MTILTGALTFYSHAALQIETAAQSLNPFNLPFSVDNPSVILAAHDIRTECTAIKIEYKGSVIANSKISNQADYSDYIKELSPGRSALTKCKMLNAGPDVKATISIGGTYRTLFINRKIAEKRYTWVSDAIPPRWIEDENAN